MERLADRTLRVLRQHPAPALTLAELRELVRGSGVVVSEERLLRVLAAESELRVLDARIGPWRSLLPPKRGRPPDGASRPRPGPRPPLRAVDLWIVGPASGDGGAVVSGSLHRLRDSLRWLGWRIDESSTSSLARWIGLVFREARLREALRGRAA